MDVPALRSQLPGTGGLEVRVLLSGIMASTARAVIETPLEYIKVCYCIESSLSLIYGSILPPIVVM